MPSLENTLGRWYSPSGPQVLARFRSPLLAAQPFAVYQVGAGEMDGDAAAPEAVDRLPPRVCRSRAVAERRASPGLDAEHPLSRV